MPVSRYARLFGTEITVFVTLELHGHYITEDGELYWPDELVFSIKRVPTGSKWGLCVKHQQHHAMCSEPISLEMSCSARLNVAFSSSVKRQGLPFTEWPLIRW